jgi:hypothetical protein
MDEIAVWPGFLRGAPQLVHLLGILCDKVFRFPDIVNQIVQLGRYLRGFLSIFVGASLAARVAGRLIFPQSLSHGQFSGTAGRVVDEVIAHRLFGCANECGSMLKLSGPTSSASG